MWELLGFRCRRLLLGIVQPGPINVEHHYGGCSAFMTINQMLCTIHRTNWRLYLFILSETSRAVKSFLSEGGCTGNYKWCEIALCLWSTLLLSHSISIDWQTNRKSADLFVWYNDMEAFSVAVNWLQNAMITVQTHAMYTM